jgi:hypothetical protein
VRLVSILRLRCGLSDPHVVPKIAVSSRHEPIFRPSVAGDEETVSERSGEGVRASSRGSRARGRTARELFSASPFLRGDALVRLTLWDRSFVFEINKLELVSQTFASWNRIGEWLRRLDELRHAA